MFSEDEIAAWCSARAGSPIAPTPAGRGRAQRARQIAAVLPADLREAVDASALLVGPGAPIAAGDAELATIRQAIKAERKLAITYVRDGAPDASAGARTERTIWPFALAFFDRVRMVVAWCELRQGFRHFRTDRIATLAVAGRYPRRRQALLKEMAHGRGHPAAMTRTPAACEQLA